MKLHKAYQLTCMFHNARFANPALQPAPGGAQGSCDDDHQQSQQSLRLVCSLVHSPRDLQEIYDHLLQFLATHRLCQPEGNVHASRLMVRPDDVGVEVRVGTVVLHDETVGSVDGDPDHKQDYDAVALTQTGLRR
jgi:hypothetical protein